VKIRLRLFAAARQTAGCDSLKLELPDGATIGQLRRQLALQIPQLAGLAEQAMFALDREYADNATAIPPGADVACIPPVSGG